jgi:hypothetical protein
MIDIAQIQDALNDGGRFADYEAQNAEDHRRQVAEVREYLSRGRFKWDEEAQPGGAMLFRGRGCPFKGKTECDDRPYVIVDPVKGITAACHADKCEGKTWADLQEAIGEPFGKPPAAPKPKRKKADDVAVIVNLAREADKLFCDSEETPYAQTMRRGKREVVKLRSDAYRNILRRRYFAATGRVAKREWIGTAVDELASIADDGERHEVFVRVASQGGKIYIDVGDDARSIIEVDRDGWRVIQDAPVYFRRPKSLRALPLPEPGGSVELIRKLVNIGSDDFPLYVGFLVMVYHPHGPYPIAAFIGGPGHAKTTTARDTQTLVDPSNVTGTAHAKKTEDLLIAARERRLVGFDNLDHIDQQQSDDLCRIATGASLTRRTMYSDADETTFTAKNPVLITSIKDVITQADLLDRSLRFVLPKLAEVKSEAIHNAEVQEAAPKILGVILDGVSSALRNLPRTSIQNPPRMIEFALWATAAEEGLGLQPGSIMAAYRRNIGEVTALTLENDLAQKVIALAGGGFAGKTSELAKKVGWEVSAHGCKTLIGELRKLQSSLEKVGVIVDCDAKEKNTTIIRISKS